MKPYYDHAGITIYHGDCREILPLLADESVTLLWTDPPYGHSNMDGDLQSARIGIKGARQADPTPIKNDSPEDMRKIVSTALDGVMRILRRDCCCCCCCCCGGGGPKPTFAWLAERMDTGGLKFFHAIVWDKTARGHGMGWRFRRDYEMIMVAHRTGGKLSWGNDSLAVSNIRHDMPVINRVHPNEKPLSLIKSFVSLTTSTGDLVLDPFMGSGTTLRAAKDLGRRAIGIDLEEKYCEIAAARLSQEVMAL
jgi:site-specific DNA-methyltransferase (adenine-specific)